MESKDGLKKIGREIHLERILAVLWISPLHSPDIGGWGEDYAIAQTQSRDFKGTVWKASKCVSCLWRLETNSHQIKTECNEDWSFNSSWETKTLSRRMRLTSSVLEPEEFCWDLQSLVRFTGAKLLQSFDGPYCTRQERKPVYDPVGFCPWRLLGVRSHYRWKYNFCHRPGSENCRREESKRETLSSKHLWACKRKGPS